MLLRRLIKHAQITPVADSMKLQRFVGADSHDGSFVLSVSGSVNMRSAVVKQMKKPMQNNTTRPTRDPNDILRPTITGIGKTNIAMSLTRFEMALDQLRTLLVISQSLTALHSPVSEKADAGPRY